MSGIELAGWVVFLLSGIAFLVAGIRARDGYVIAGSAFFVVGVLLVMKGTAHRH